MPARPVFQRGTARANRVGVMMLAATLCQWLIPATSLFFLRLMGVDTAADHWGLPHVQYLLTYAVLYILMLGVPLVLCRIFLAPQEKPHSRRRLSVDQTVCLIAVGTALCLLANILSALFCDWLYSLGIPKPQLSLPDDGSLITLLLDLTVFALLPALLEEALLRGLILKTLRPLGSGIAVAVSSVLFGLLHGNVEQIPFTVLLGLVLGAVYVATEDLRPCMAIHAISNALALTVRFIMAHMPAQTAAFLELTLLTLVLLAGGAAALWLWRHPLPLTASAVSVPLILRVRSLLRAPLLWSAVGALLLMTVIHIL